MDCSTWRIKLSRLSNSWVVVKQTAPTVLRRIVQWMSWPAIRRAISGGEFASQCRPASVVEQKLKFKQHWEVNTARVRGFPGAAQNVVTATKIEYILKRPGEEVKVWPRPEPYFWYSVPNQRNLASKCGHLVDSDKDTFTLGSLGREKGKLFLD